MLVDADVGGAWMLGDADAAVAFPVTDVVGSALASGTIATSSVSS